MKKQLTEKRAIDFIKQMVSEGQISRGVVEKYFPELVETQDERMRNALSMGLIDIVKDAGWSDFGGIPIEDIQDWLKSIGHQNQCDYNPYKATVAHVIKMCNKYECRIKDRSEAKDFLVNIKAKCKDAIEYDKKYSQKQWKPSNKQMEALRYIYQNFNPPLSDKQGWNSLKTLELMYRNLKKLREE